MEIYRNCPVDILYYEKEASQSDTYIVRISDTSIEVAFDDDDGPVCYKGKNDGSGHFLLEAPEREGRASLHKFPKGKFLEGHWMESGYRGMWRITLKD